MPWDIFFKEESKKTYAIELHRFLDKEYAEYTIFPPRQEMFRAFELTPLDKIKVVIIGQDPYHEKGQAMGLSFSVPKGCPMPPSLVNIYKEIQNDLGVKMKNNGDLTYLASQGVLLLNAMLSVREGEALSHQGHGYEEFLKNVLKYIDRIDQPIVFMLWGSFARNLKPFITHKKRYILESVHPSPLSANRGGFFGTHQFTKCNTFLVENDLTPISWNN
jgi:uracil-DNA glycosylase